MGIKLSQDQLKQLSADYVGYPDQIAQQEASIQFILQEVENLKKKDAENTTFQNYYLEITNQYHRELVNLIGEQRTNYDTSAIDPAARGIANSAHYPGTNANDIWKRFSPKLIPSNNGQPISQTLFNERTELEEVQKNINLIRAGFSSGAVSTSAVSGLIGNTLIVGSSAIVIGNNIIVNSGSNSFYGLVTGVSSVSGGTQLTLQFIHPTSPSSISSGATVANFWSGLSNTNRQTLSGGVFQDVLNSVVTDTVNRLNRSKANLSNQLDAISRNESIGGEVKEKADAVSNIQRFQNAIAAWESNPNTGLSGRYADPVVVNLLNEIVFRLRNIGVRFGKINLRLGTVTQDESTGDYGGTGHYRTLIDWVNLRVNKMMGTLRMIYGSEDSLNAIRQRIQVFKSKQSQIEDLFTISKVSEKISQNRVKIESVRGFAVGDNVKIIANDQDLISGNIQTIADNEIVFDRIIPDTYNLGNLLRVLKQK